MIRQQPNAIFDHITSALVRVVRFVQEVNVGLAALHRVQFEEPWKPVRKPTYGEW